MRVTILTYGSQGDVQPCLALAIALQQAGHSPLLALPAVFRHQADDAGIPAVSLSGDIAALSRGFNQAGKNPYKMMRTMQHNIEPIALDVACSAHQACRNADLIVHTFAFTLGAHAFARQLSIPDVSVQFFPFFISSMAYPLPTFPTLPLGRLYNLLTHRFGMAIFARLQRLMYPRIRKAAPQLPARLPWPFQASADRAATPLLLAYSPTLVPPEPDWDAHIHPTGFWFFDPPTAYHPPPELDEFLAGGPPPVVVGFGSMIHPESAGLQRRLLEGLRRAGQRAVILTGWDGWRGNEPGIDRLFLEAVPHHWLFPRCGAILHHGGAGTTAAALRSGQPNVVLPLAADQFFWARRIHACGAGPAPLSARSLTADQVAEAVCQALESEAIRRDAAALGSVICGENGIQKAVGIIESLFPAL